MSSPARLALDADITDPGAIVGAVADAATNGPLTGVQVAALGVLEPLPGSAIYLPLVLRGAGSTSRPVAPTPLTAAVAPLGSSVTFTTTTAADGSFALSVPAGAYTLTLTLSGFAPDRRATTVRPHQTSRVQEVRLHTLDPVAVPIGTGGGTVTNSLANTSLQFPAGAVAETVQARVTYLPNDALPGFFPDGSIPMGFANLEPEGLVLPQGKEVLWTVAYTGTAPVGTDTLCYWWDGTQARWRDPVPGKIVDAGGSKKAIQASVHHFSQYGHALPGIAGQKPTGGQATVTNANAGQGADQTDCPGCLINVGAGSVSESYSFLPVSGKGFPVVLTARYSSSNDTPTVTARVPFTITTQTPARASWRLEFQGKVYTGEGYDARAIWDTRNALGGRVAPGLYPYSAVETFYYDSGAQPSMAVSGTVEVRRGDVWPFGVNWISSYDTLLVDNSTTVTVIQGDGQYLTYTRQPDGSYAAPAGDFGLLARQVGGAWTRTSSNNIVQSFDASGRLTRIQDPNGNAHTLSYEPTGQVLPPGAWGPTTRLKTIIDASARSWILSYGADGYVSAVTDPLGAQYTLSHDAGGNLTAIVDPIGRTTAYQYDANHLLTQVVDPLGHATRITYDTSGRVISHRDALGHERTASYGDGSTTVVNERGFATTYQSNAFGAITRTSNPVQTLNYTYDDQRQLSTSDAPAQEMTYDDRGNLTEYDNFTEVTASYDASNRLTSFTDGTGNTTQLAYDAHGNPTRITDPLGNEARFEYDTIGQMTRMVDPLEQITVMEYDAYGNVTRLVDPLGAESKLAYDAAGNLVTATDALNHSASFSYDAAHRLTAATNALGRTTSYEYDAADNVTRVRDARGNSTVFTYDVLNRPSTRMDAPGNTTALAYDPAGNLASLTDANGATTQLTYDAANRPTKIQYPGGEAVTMAYNTIGDLTGYLGTGTQVKMTYASGIPGNPDLVETRWTGGPALSSQVAYDYATSSGTLLMATGALESEPGAASDESAEDRGAEAPQVSEPEPDQGKAELLPPPAASGPDQQTPPQPYAELVTPLGTVVGGVISTNATWTLAGSPYIIGSGSVIVAAGVTLTIEPGVVVKVDHWSKYLNVNGTLVADGDAGHPIIFTSYKDDTAAGDTNGDGNATQPAPGDWGSVQFANTSTGNVLDYAVVRYGGPGVGANVVVNTTAIVLTHNTLARSYYGLLLNNALPPIISGNSFISNTNCAINAPLTNNAGSLTLRDNTAAGNAANGFCTGGTLSGSPVWDGDPNFPFVLNADLTVNAGAKLTLTPGTIVKPNHWSRRVTINGTLIADGDEAHPIIITSLADDEAGGDTNNNGPTLPLPSEWHAVRFEAGSAGSVLNHVILRYGGANLAANVVVNTTSVTLTNSTFFRGYTGLLLNNALPPVLTGNRFIDNVGCAVSAPLTNNAGSITLRGNAATGNATNGVCIGGSVSGSPVWDGDPNVPFVLTVDLTVNAGAKLTVKPGTIIKLNHWSRQVFVNGALDARGDAARPIIFTAIQDDTAGGDTNNDGAATQPAAANWRTIRFANTSAGSVFDNVTARYGGALVYGLGCAHVNTTDITFTNSTFSQCDCGLSVSGASPAITGNTFTANRRGVYTAGGARPVLRSNRIAGNSEWGVYNSDPSVIVDAEHNQWGGTKGPLDASDDRGSGGLYNPEGNGDRVTDKVDYAPWDIISGLLYGIRIATGSNPVQTVRYGYDPLNRLSSLTASGPAAFLRQYAYDAAGRLTASGPVPGNPGIATTLEYDDAGRATRLINRSPDGGATFSDFEYVYDQAGYLHSAQDTAGTTNYTYDAQGQLTAASGPGLNETYSYDEVGNRLSKSGLTHTYNAGNQLVSSSDGTVYTYDRNGNLRTRTTGGQTTAYMWDVEDRLVRIDFPDGSHAAYTYDALGHRLSKRDRSGLITYYVYDGLDLVQEVDVTGVVLANYVYDTLDHPLSMTRGGATYFYLFDGLGNVVGLTDGAGTLVAGYRYDPWGNSIATGGSNPALANPFRFAGREWDAESELYYFRARYYDPGAGRFIGRDPLNAAWGPDYAYAMNNPLAFRDPLGLEPLTDLTARFLIQMCQANGWGLGPELLARAAALGIPVGPAARAAAHAVTQASPRLLPPAMGLAARLRWLKAALAAGLSKAGMVVLAKLAAAFAVGYGIGYMINKGLLDCGTRDAIGDWLLTNYNLLGSFWQNRGLLARHFGNKFLRWLESFDAGEDDELPPGNLVFVGVLA